MELTRDRKTINQRSKAAMDTRATFAISGERINADKSANHHSAAQLKSVLDYDIGATRSSNDTPTSKLSNQSKDIMKPRAHLAMKDLALANFSDSNPVPVPEFKSTLKVSRTNLAKFGTPQITSNKSNKTFSAAQQPKDSDFFSNGSNEFVLGNGSRFRANSSFNESLTSATNPSIFRDNSKGQMSPHSQLGLSIVGNKHFERQSQEMSQQKNSTNTFITESKKDLDESIRNGAQVILNRSNVFYQPPGEISFNLAYSNSIQKRNPRQIAGSKSLTRLKKEDIGAVTDQHTPQLRFSSEKAAFFSLNDDASPSKKVRTSQKSLDRSLSLSKNFIYQNPNMNDFGLTQSQVSVERKSSMNTNIEKNLSPTNIDNNSISPFGDSIDAHLFGQGFTQMPNDLLSRFTTTKAIGGNYIGNKLSNEKLQGMLTVNQKKQLDQLKSIPDQSSKQDTGPVTELAGVNEGKIEKAVAAKIELDEVLNRNMLDPETESEINSVLRKYSLEKSFWENYLEDKKMMLGKSQLFSGAGSENPEIDVKLEIKKFKKEYKLYQGRKSKFANASSDREAYRQRYDPNSDDSQTPQGRVPNQISGFSNSVKKNSPSSSFDLSPDKKSTDSSPVPNTNNLGSESPIHGRGGSYLNRPRPLSGFARQKETPTLTVVGAEVIHNFEDGRAKLLAEIGSKVLGDNFLSPGTFAELQGFGPPMTQDRPYTQGRSHTGKYVPSFKTIYDHGQKIGSKQSLLNDHSFLGDGQIDPEQLLGLDRNPSIFKNMETHSSSPMHKDNAQFNHAETHRKRPPVSPIKAFDMALPEMPKRKENSNQSKAGTNNIKRRSKQTIPSFENLGEQQHHQRDDSRKSSYNKTKADSFNLDNVKTARSGYTWTASEISSRSADGLPDDPEEEKTIQSESVSQTLRTEYDSSSCVSRTYNQAHEEPNLIKNALALGVEYTGPLKKEALLGKGSEAKVYLVELPNGEKAAMKNYEIMRNDEKDMTIFKKLKSEFLMFKNLNHSNIVRYLSLYHPEKQPFPNAIEFGVLMEYMQGGPLDEYLDSGHSKISLHEKKSLIKQIFQGLDFLHSQHIVHRDLKPGNLLLSKDKKTVKITDFGVSKKSENQAFQSCVGTAWYMAPEVTKSNEGYSFSADIYSAGCCVFHVMTGKKPYEKQSEFQVMRLKREDSKSPLDVCGEEVLRIIESYDYLKEFLDLCFNQDKSQRTSAKELLAHPFLHGAGLDASQCDPSQESKWQHVDPNDDNGAFLLTALTYY